MQGYKDLLKLQAARNKGTIKDIQPIALADLKTLTTRFMKYVTNSTSAQCRECMKDGKLSPCCTDSSGCFA